MEVQSQKLVTLEDIATEIYKTREGLGRDLSQIVGAVRADIDGLKKEQEIGNIIGILNSGIQLPAEVLEQLEKSVTVYATKKAHSINLEEELGSVFK